jgi:Cellulose binding domain
MRYFGVATVVALIAIACAEQNNPLPEPSEDTGDSGSGGGNTTGGKASGGSGGSAVSKAGTTSGGKASGGTENEGGAPSENVMTAGAGGKASGGAGGKASGGASGSAGTGGKASGGAGGSAGSGGKGGSGGTAGTGGSGCTPSTSGPIGGISARYQGEKKSDMDFNIGSMLIIANTGQSTLNLADLKLRYYFTNEVTAPVTLSINWAYFRPNPSGQQTDADKGKVTPALVAMTCTTPSANAYIEFTFAATIGNLTPGNQIFFSWSGTNTASQKFTQSNDYSFDAAAVQTADTTKLVVLQNSGTRVWGTEP